MKIDAGDLAGGLEEGWRRLEAAIAAVDQADAQGVWAREGADRAFVEAERVVSSVARGYEGLGGLAGEGEIGKRIRRCFR